MRIGLVSNCWQQQLESGAELTALIAQAADAGCECIELRQTCLGNFEHGDPPVPNASRLTDLPASFPEVVFNVAVNVPFLQPDAVGSTPVFAAAVNAAQAVGGKHRPHLRLVDLTTSAAQLVNADPHLVAQGIARLAEPMIQVGGQLSIEHSLQPWRPFLSVFRNARSLLAEHSERLQLCYDPVNLFFSDTDVDPGAATRSLAAEEISMVHFKQRRDGTVLPRMDDGDVDWREQIETLDSIEYRGPYLFEIRSTDDIWNELEYSAEYLRKCGFRDTGSQPLA